MWLIGHIDWASKSLFTAKPQVVSQSIDPPKYTRHSIQCVATWTHPANLTPTQFMKKSPHWFFFFLFMCCCCSRSFSTRRRLHTLQPGSNWIELVCGGVPVRLATQSPHLRSFSRWSSGRQLWTTVCVASLTQISAAHGPPASKWQHAAPLLQHLGTKTKIFARCCYVCYYVPPLFCYFTLFSSPCSIVFQALVLAWSLSFQPTIACSCSQKFNRPFQRKRNEKPQKIGYFLLQ